MDMMQTFEPSGPLSGSDVASAYWNARNSFTATALLPGQYNDVPLDFPLGDQSNWSADGNLTCLQSGLYSILAISAINGVVDSGFGSNNGLLSTRILINYHGRNLEPGANVDALEGTSVALTALDAYFFYALQGFSLQVLNGGSVAGAVTTTVHLVKLF